MIILLLLAVIYTEKWRLCVCVCGRNTRWTWWSTHYKNREFREQQPRVWELFELCEKKAEDEFRILQQYYANHNFCVHKYIYFCGHSHYSDGNGDKCENKLYAVWLEWGLFTARYGNYSFKSTSEWKQMVYVAAKHERKHNNNF